MGTVAATTSYAPRALVSSSDEKYSPGLIVLLASALGRLPAGFPVDVVVFDEGLATRTRMELQRIVGRARTNSRLHLEPGFSQLGRPLPVARHVTLATYSRLLIPELSPQLDRAVYVDADLLAADDISELFTMDLHGAVFAACADTDTPTVETGVPYSFQALGLPRDRPYLNAGVLVFDVARWREARIGPATEEYVRRWETELRCPDQEGINAVAGDRALVLDGRFNFQVSGEGLAAKASRTARSAHRDLRKAALVHFTGPKPWLNLWFSSTVWARPAAWWWSVALGSRLISPRTRLSLCRLGAGVAARELSRLVAPRVSARR